MKLEFGHFLCAQYYGYSQITDEETEAQKFICFIAYSQQVADLESSQTQELPCYVASFLLPSPKQPVPSVPKWV